MAVLLLVAGVMLAVMIPAYVIGKRSGTEAPWIAFIPFVGPWIAALRAAGIGGGWVALVLLPTLGALILIVWISVVLPKTQHRSQWWTLPFLVPGVNLIAYWVYAFTLGARDAEPELVQLEQRQVEPSSSPELVQPEHTPAPEVRAYVATAAPTDIAAQLGQLAALHQQGALSDSEFAAAKASLLALQQG